MENYNKFQYSYFLENGAQVVIRGGDPDEFVADVNWAKSQFPIVSSPAAKIADQARAKTAPTEDCPICHAPAYINEGIGKNGKPYKNKKCSSRNPDHIIWWDFELDGWKGL